MGTERYEEIQCKSVLNRVHTMAFGWSINPYRGCVHSCHYCFARRYHGYFDLNASEDFTGIIFVKVNAPQVLRQELSRPSWRREEVVLGTATDPYQPIEGKYRITRGILSALHDYRTPVGIVTKGTLAVRDADLLASLSHRARCTVSFSVTTLDAETWRRLEPGTPPPLKRLQAMQWLVEAGVNAGVLLAPVVPGVTASLENLSEVVRAAAGHGARFIGTSVLYLKPGVKEHFNDFLRREYPGLLPRYRGMFPGAYAPKGYARRVRDLVTVLQERYGVLAPPQAGPEPDRGFEAGQQLALAL